MNQGKKFSEIAVGDLAKFEVLVDEEMHSSFAKLISDFSPIHTDDIFCSKTKFKRRVGYAFLLTSFLSRLYGHYLPGGSSVCVKQEVKFIKPFYVGDRLTIRGQVIRKVLSTKLVEIKSEAFRNTNEKVFEGMGIVQIFV